VTNENKALGQDFANFKETVRQIPEVADYLNSFSVVIGNLVFARRMQLGLSQQELAAQAETTQATISRVEAGDDGVKSGTLNRIFKELKLADINPIYSEDAAAKV
jgi:ribosome-binding protein aMBF1 (putative translation factor)